jgi:hypothetical protein
VWRAARVGGDGDGDVGGDALHRLDRRGSREEDSGGGGWGGGGSGGGGGGSGDASGVVLPPLPRKAPSSDVVAAGVGGGGSGDGSTKGGRVPTAKPGTRHKDGDEDGEEHQDGV